jgi:hypothetical protein
MRKITACTLVLGLVGCASNPQVIVDPKSITDGVKYNRDMAECKTMSEKYDTGAANAGSAMLGAGAGVATAALVLATGGLYLLPAGVVVAGGGGAALGGGISQSRESQAREKIWAECLNDRGYKAYTSK